MSKVRLQKALPGFAVLTAAVLAGLSGVAGAATTQELIDAGEARAAAAQADQRRIEQVADQIDQLTADYETEAKVVDGLVVYNSLLQRQIDNQEAEMAAIADSIQNVELIERQITPLMTRMLDSLETFVELDTPFLLDERRDRIVRLRTMMDRSDVSPSEKLRQILEAYSIENDYGRTIEAYKGSLEVDGRALEVDFLRIGRVSLTYQSVGGGVTGAWDSTAGDYVQLPPEVYKTQVAEGLRVARKQIAPDLIIAPVAAPTGVSQ
ncbi:MAG: DUF3450 domain-containing protein [Pseudomonadota bacterium]